jgi:Fic family protein
VPKTTGDKEVSIHEARLFAVLMKCGGEWLTSQEIAKKSKVAERTSRNHLKKLAELGLVERVKVFPGHRYRISKVESKQGNAAHLAKLEMAIKVFGLGRE